VVRLLALLSLLGVGCFAACADGQESEGRGPELFWADSAGVRVLEIPVDFPIPHSDLREEPLSIVTGQDHDPIGGVRGLIWLDSSRIALADDDMTVRVYDRTGRRLRIAGGRGQGPGEFWDILWIDHGFDGGFAVFDPNLNRLSIFDSTLAFERVIIPPSSAGVLVFWAGFLPQQLGMAGAELMNEPGAGRRQPPSRWGYTSVLASSQLHTGVDTVTRFAWNRCREEVRTRCAPEGWSGGIDPVGDKIYLTPLDWPEVRIYSSSGELLSIMRHVDPTGDGFAQLVVDHRERAWASREAEVFWTLYDPSMPSVRRFTFPERFRLTDIRGSSAIGVLRDSLNVSYVAILELDAGDGL